MVVKKGKCMKSSFPPESELQVASLDLFESRSRRTMPVVVVTIHVILQSRVRCHRLPYCYFGSIVISSSLCGLLLAPAMHSTNSTAIMEDPIQFGASVLVRRVYHITKRPLYCKTTNIATSVTKQNAAPQDSRMGSYHKFLVICCRPIP